MDPNRSAFKKSGKTHTDFSLQLGSAVPLVPHYKSFYLLFAVKENRFFFIILTLKDVCNSNL